MPFTSSACLSSRSPTPTSTLEQPIFSTKAHVFQIDPNTKKKWLPVSSQAVNVAYYHDSTRNTYRIISVDGSKAVINSTIMPNMTFTKTSQKFGQWSDSRANTVYGLGFPSEAELAKFIEKFKEVKELTRQAQASGTSQQPPESLPASASPGQTNGTENSVSNHVKVDPPISGSPINSPRPVSTSTPPIQNDVSSVDRHASSSSSPSLPSNQHGSQVVEQLKYENDRLKIALAQSSANAKKWEVELQTLKNNNARLTTALQESTSNVEQWKKQLASYKEESARLKKKVMELERGGGSSELIQKQLTDTREKVTELEQTVHDKQEEIIGLKSQLDSMKPVQEQNKKLQEKIQALEQEKAGVNAKFAEQQQKADNINMAHNRERQQLRSVQQQLANKLSEVYDLNAKFAELTQSPS